MKLRSLLGSFIIFGGITVVVLLTGSGYWINVASLMVVYGLLALSTNLIFGLAGQISFGQVGLMAVGSYVTALLEVRADVPFMVAAATALVTCILLSIIVGIPVLRLKHHYLAMSTFAFHVIVSVVLKNWIDVTGGPLGVIGLSRLSIFGRSDSEAYLVFSMALFLIVFVLLENLVASSVGRSFLAVREDEQAAAALGIPVARVKTFAFALSAAIAGLAGIVYTHLNNYISPDTFSIEVAVLAFMMVMIGGRGHNIGVLIGVVIFTILPELVRTLQDFNEIFMSGVLILILLFLPNGLVQLTPRLRRLSKIALDRPATAADAQSGKVRS